MFGGTQARRAVLTGTITENVVKIRASQNQATVLNRDTAMTRMTREFTLVLLGAGLLTAWAVAKPERDLEQQADDQAQDRVFGDSADNGANGTNGEHQQSSHRSTHYRGPAFIYIGSFGGGGGTSAGRSPAMSNVSKGGFGSVGGRTSAS
jgi:hypothetical protein